MIFLHLPKCGGISLQDLVASQYPEAQRRFIYKNELNISAPNQMFVYNLMQSREDVKMIYGHMAFNVHRLLGIPPLYATVFRDPVKRVISFYKFLYANKRVRNNLRIGSEKQSLKKFVENQVTGQTSNYMTQMIIGCPSIHLKTFSSDAILRIAKLNIEKKFFFTGILETLNDDIKMMASSLGWMKCHLPRKNITRAPRSEGIDKETREIIMAHNKLDIALYEWVKARPQKLNPGVMERALARPHKHTGVSLPVTKKNKDTLPEKLVVGVQLPCAVNSGFSSLLLDICPGPVFIDNDDKPLHTPQKLREKQALNMTVEKLSANIPEASRWIYGRFLPLKYLPLQKQRKLAFFTWFCDPVRRTLVHYEFWKAQKVNDASPGALKQMHQENWSLETFCKQDALQNVYSQFLWQMPLEKFDFIGIAEHFERDLALFFKTFQFESDLPYLKIFTQLEKNQNALPISDKSRRLIESYNQADILLYEKAKERNRELRVVN